MSTNFVPMDSGDVGSAKDRVRSPLTTLLDQTSNTMNQTTEDEPSRTKVSAEERKLASEASGADSSSKTQQSTVKRSESLPTIPSWIRATQANNTSSQNLAERGQTPTELLDSLTQNRNETERPKSATSESLMQTRTQSPQPQTGTLESTRQIPNSGAPKSLRLMLLESKKNQRASRTPTPTPHFPPQRTSRTHTPTPHSPPQEPSKAAGIAVNEDNTKVGTSMKQAYGVDKREVDQKISTAPRKDTPDKPPRQDALKEPTVDGEKKVDSSLKQAYEVKNPMDIEMEVKIELEDIEEKRTSTEMDFQLMELLASKIINALKGPAVDGENAKLDSSLKQAREVENPIEIATRIGQRTAQRKEPSPENDSQVRESLHVRFSDDIKEPTVKEENAEVDTPMKQACEVQDPTENPTGIGMKTREKHGPSADTNSQVLGPASAGHPGAIKPPKVSRHTAGIDTHKKQTCEVQNPIEINTRTEKPTSQKETSSTETYSRAIGSLPAGPIGEIKNKPVNLGYASLVKAFKKANEVNKPIEITTGTGKPTAEKETPSTETHSPAMGSLPEGLPGATKKPTLNGGNAKLDSSMKKANGVKKTMEITTGTGKQTPRKEGPPTETNAQVMESLPTGPFGAIKRKPVNWEYENMVSSMTKPYEVKCPIEVMKQRENRQQTSRRARAKSDSDLKCTCVDPNLINAISYRKRGLSKIDSGGTKTARTKLKTVSTQTHVTAVKSDLTSSDLVGRQGAKVKAAGAAKVSASQGKKGKKRNKNSKDQQPEATTPPAAAQAVSELVEMPKDIVKILNPLHRTSTLRPPVMARREVLKQIEDFNMSREVDGAQGVPQIQSCRRRGCERVLCVEKRPDPEASGRVLIVLSKKDRSAVHTTAPQE